MNVTLCRLPSRRKSAGCQIVILSIWWPAIPLLAVENRWGLLCGAVFPLTSCRNQTGKASRAITLLRLRSFPGSLPSALGIHTLLWGAVGLTHTFHGLPVCFAILHLLHKLVSYCSYWRGVLESQTNAPSEERTIFCGVMVIGFMGTGSWTGSITLITKAPISLQDQ